MMKVRITKNNKFQQMPMIAYKKQDGTLDYINNIPDGGIVVVIDTYTLEDYIKFHNIEYEIIEGVYYNEGYNTKIGELIKHLFQQRDIYKKEEKESLQLACKLMMNSIYGKSIMKQNKENIVIVDVKDLDTFILKYFNTIKMMVPLNTKQIEEFDTDQTEQEKRENRKQVKVYLASVDRSSNYGQVGCSILSYSKRIMNEVFDIANEKNVPIYYTDTDSIHILASGIKTVEDEYFRMYGKELHGKGLGQFHSDFDITLNKKWSKKVKCENVVAVKSMFIGKKIYCDILEGHDFINNKTIQSSHVRIKGVTKAGIDDCIKNKYNGNVAGLFEDLCDEKEVKFILNPGDNVLFEYSSSGVYLKRGEFPRTL